MSRKENKTIDEIFQDSGFLLVSQDDEPEPETAADPHKLDPAERELLDHLKYIVSNEAFQKNIVSPPAVEAVQPDRTPVQPRDRRVDAYDIPVLIEYLLWHIKRICSIVIDREDIVKQAFFAILTGEHMLLLSRTGMAKSFLATYIFNTFEGARVFSAQASKDQTPDNYFGPYNIEEFKKGRIKHNVMGSVIEANLVFLDEFFDASDVVLRSLLSVLNERKFINGQEQIDTAVHTAVATANYMRLNEVTEAVLDRFTYKAIIPENSNSYTQFLIDRTYESTRGNPSYSEKKINFDQILYLTDVIKNRSKDLRIDFPDIIYFMKNVVVNRFVGEMRKHDQGYFISPRKTAKLSDFLRANALMNNRFEVLVEDLGEMYIPLCTANSYISVKAKDKSERDVFLDTFRQTMTHFSVSGAFNQAEFLLNVRRLFQEMKENPAGRDVILQQKGLIDGLVGILKRLFPGRTRADDSVSVESLKRSVMELNPAVAEIEELKQGILVDYRDIH